MPRLRSLKARLVGLTVAAVVLVWLATLAVSYLEARHEVDELLDGHLAQAAAMLLAQAGHDLDEVDTEHAPLLHKYARRVAFQVFDDHGRLGLHSANAPNVPLAAPGEGFSETLVEGERWRVFTTQGGELTIHVGEHAEARAELARELVGGMLKPLLLAIPALALVLSIGIGRGLAPLSRIAREVAARAPDKLAPLSVDAMPAEVRPLADRLNELFARLERSLDSERRFTADAAHELRTPLAAIRAQAQVALGAAEAPAREHALAAVLAGCDRAARLIEQLLTLARIDHVAAAAAESVGLRRLAGEVIGEIGAFAIARDVDLGLDDGGEATVAGHAGLLRILLRNLIDNAVRYTPAGGEVRVAVAATPAGATLAVRDSGPGIAAEERERVMQRFYRVLGNGEEGSGLGLSIVARIAALHAAEVVLAEAAGGRGLRVAIVFAGSASSNAGAATARAQ